MKRFRFIAIAAGLALMLVTGTGCFRLLKLFEVEMGTLSAVNGASSAGKYIVLEDESSDYADNKDKIKAVEDYSLFGTITNNLASPVSAEVWIIENPTSPALLPDRDAVEAAGGTKLLTVDLAASESKPLDWGPTGSRLAFRRLFGGDGDPVTRELEGDGVFTLYVFGSTSTYDVSVTNASFVVTVYVGS